MPAIACLKKLQRPSILSIGLFVGVTALQPNMAIAQTTLVPEGQCAVVVASRQTIEDARNYIERNIIDPAGTVVFRSQNGWYAISIGALATEIQADWLAREKSAGRVPGDAYCSMGARFEAVVAWGGTNPAPTAPTVQTSVPSGAANTRESTIRVETDDLPASDHMAILASLPRNIYSTGCNSVLERPMAESSRSELQAFLECLDDRDESENLAITTVIKGLGLKLVKLDSGVLRIEDDKDSGACFDVCWEKAHDRLWAITMRTGLREVARSQARDALWSR
ncbi:MAG: hypothetical protein JJU24_08255 [Natronohydrobacter sp.]|nr:hypothetical protein [Natronohydrobacter sp.]